MTVDRVPVGHSTCLCNKQCKQFDYDSFGKWRAELCIPNYFSIPIHPQANGQVEVTNKTLMTTLKKKLDDRNGAWVNFLPEVQRSYRTMARTPTGVLVLLTSFC
jgi:transposase InsO family protein